MTNYYQFQSKIPTPNRSPQSHGYSAVLTGNEWHGAVTLNIRFMQLIVFFVIVAQYVISLWIAVLLYLRCHYLRSMREHRNLFRWPWITISLSWFMLFQPIVRGRGSWKNCLCTFLQISSGLPYLFVYTEGLLFLVTRLKECQYIAQAFGICSNKDTDVL